VTPKERVLKRHPGAWLWLQPGYSYFILPRRAFLVRQNIGSGDTPREAWADAAKGLRR
jgi:hypothetical protein